MIPYMRRRVLGEGLYVSPIRIKFAFGGPLGKRRSKADREQGGFTFLEVLVTFTLMVCGLMALLGAMLSSQILSRQAKEMNVANAALINAVEEFREKAATNYDDALVSYGADPDPTTQAAANGGDGGGDGGGEGSEAIPGVDPTESMVKGLAAMDREFWKARIGADDLLAAFTSGALPVDTKTLAGLVRDAAKGKVTAASLKKTLDNAKLSSSLLTTPSEKLAAAKLAKDAAIPGAPPMVPGEPGNVTFDPMTGEIFTAPAKKVVDPARAPAGDAVTRRLPVTEKLLADKIAKLDSWIARSQRRLHTAPDGGRVKRRIDRLKARQLELTAKLKHLEKRRLQAKTGGGARDWLTKLYETAKTLSTPDGLGDDAELKAAIVTDETRLDPPVDLNGDGDFLDTNVLAQDFKSAVLRLRVSWSGVGGENQMEYTMVFARGEFK